MRQSYNSLLSTTEENNLTTYFSEIRKIPLLTREQEEETVRKVALGDEKAREKLISSNLQLVVSIAKSYSNPELSILDLISEGNIGLMNAVEKYKLGKGTKFSYYAYYWITDSILKALNQIYSPIPLSFGLNERVTKARAYLDNDYSFKEVADIFHWTESQFSDLLGKRTIESLNLPISKKENSDYLIDAIPDNSQNVSEKFFQGLERETIMYHLGEALSEREVEILKMKHGFYFNLEYFLEDIGNFVGNISRERVRQIHDKAIKKLKENPNLKEIMASGVTK
ncbi:MAG: RNA polymerase sigma factor RpoD/SigA [Candidatus Pacearchaeota archaeon]|jgi:RNA polymerase primary sigma factor